MASKSLNFNSYEEGKKWFERKKGKYILISHGPSDAWEDAWEFIYEDNKDFKKRCEICLREADKLKKTYAGIEVCLVCKGLRDNGHTWDEIRKIALSEIKDKE